MVTLQFQPIGAPEKCLDRAIQISASSWRKTMNRRHSQSSYATPVKSLPMSDDANAAIGTSRKRCHPRAMSEIHRIVLQNSLWCESRTIIPLVETALAGVAHDGAAGGRTRTVFLFVRSR